MRNSYTQWCNENEARRYPFDDTATLVDSSGARMPDDILVDACLVLPPEYADAYCSSLRITPHLVSISFVHSGAPLLVGTIALAQYRPYTAVALTPLTAGVSGWVSFGSHKAVVSEQYLFNGAAQSGLACRALRIIRPPPVTWLSGLGLEQLYQMMSLVTLVGGGALRVYQDNSDPTNLKIAVELDPTQGTSFLGPCNQYADAGYQIPPVRSINGVPADAHGNINLHFIE